MTRVRIAGQWARVEWDRAQADRMWIDLQRELDRRLADDMDWYAVQSDLNEEWHFPLVRLWRDEGGSE